MASVVGKCVYIPRTLIQIVQMLELSGFCLELCRTLNKISILSAIRLPTSEAVCN
jgi:hypothetical protein